MIFKKNFDSFNFKNHHYASSELNNLFLLSNNYLFLFFNKSIKINKIQQKITKFIKI